MLTYEKFKQERIIALNKIARFNRVYAQNPNSFFQKAVDVAAAELDRLDRANALHLPRFREEYRQYQRAAATPSQIDAPHYEEPCRELQAA